MIDKWQAVLYGQIPHLFTDVQLLQHVDYGNYNTKRQRNKFN